MTSPRSIVAKVADRHHSILCLLFALFCCGAQAVDYRVPVHGFLQLPADSNTIGSMSVGAQGHVMVPSDVSELVIASLVMQAGSSIRLAPRDGTMTLRIEQASFGKDSKISGAGLSGDMGVPGGSGVDLELLLPQASIQSLTLDLSGGRGGDGWTGLQGDDGRDATCWGLAADDGMDGTDGGDGLPGGNGGRVTLWLGNPQWQEHMIIDLSGGKGGAGGVAGKGGRAGEGAHCLMYQRGEATMDGADGSAGRAAENGQVGVLTVKAL